jgi:hypothetical protein
LFAIIVAAIAAFTCGLISRLIFPTRGNIESKGTSFLNSVAFAMDDISLNLYQITLLQRN